MMTFLPLILLQGVFYPSVTEIYQQGKPLTALYCTVPDVLSFASDNRLEQQKKLYKMIHPVEKSVISVYNIQIQIENSL